jgi:NAD(P)H-nitrite reductase large subunit
MKYIIIGNGFAGIRAIEQIRENDDEGEIILISDEENYSRPLISYYLGKKVSGSAMPYRSDEFFQTHKVKMKIGQKAAAIDVKKKSVKLATGELLGYDRLLLATGGSPIVPSIPGIDSKGVFNFVTFDQAKKIEAYIQSNKVKSAVVLGGGLIGLKATEALLDLGIQVSVIELADRILSATFDKKASGIIEKALALAHCDVITETTIEKIISKDGNINAVELKKGQKIDTQLLIVAIGVRPNLELATETPIKINRGFVVNDFMETSVEGIYAAGDCAESNKWVIAILPIAARQGKIAGFNMSCKNPEDKKIYPGGFPMNSVELAGIPTISVGITEPKGDPNDFEILERFEPKKNVYKKFIIEDNRLIGAIFVSEIDRAGIFTGIIKDGVDVSSFKDELMKDTFGLVSLPKSIRKYIVTGEPTVN